MKTILLIPLFVFGLGSMANARTGKCDAAAIKAAEVKFGSNPGLVCFGDGKVVGASDKEDILEIAVYSNGPESIDCTSAVYDVQIAPSCKVVEVKFVGNLND